MEYKILLVVRSQEGMDTNIYFEKEVADGFPSKVAARMGLQYLAQVIEDATE